MTEPQDLPWTSNTSVTTTVRRLLHGTFLGRSATAWDDSGAQWDGSTEIVATQKTQVIEGELLGPFPEYGSVRYEGNALILTDATIRIEYPAVFVNREREKAGDSSE